LSFGSEYFDFVYEQADQWEFNKLLDFGFDVSISKGIVTLSKNKDAMAKVLLEDVYLEHGVLDVIEFRFGDDKKHALLEIITVYLEDDSKTINQIRDDIVSDWQLTDAEKEKKLSLDYELLND
jgi:hypothetical protein